MQNYYIEKDGDDIFYLYYEGVFIGTVTKCIAEPGFNVAPAWGNHVGYFLTLERACIELVSHSYSRQHGDMLEC